MLARSVVTPCGGRGVEEDKEEKEVDEVEGAVKRLSQGEGEAAQAHPVKVAAVALSQDEVEVAQAHPVKVAAVAPSQDEAEEDQVHQVDASARERRCTYKRACSRHRIVDCEVDCERSVDT